MTRNLELFASTPLEHLIEEHPGIFLRVDEIQMSVRTRNCLLSNDLLYVGDLIQEGKQSLLRIPNFGRKSLREIKDVLSLINLSLGTDLPNWPPDDIDNLRQKHLRKMTKAKEKLYTLTHHVTASSLEEELFNIANQNGERNTQIFIQRMGWDGRGGKTLGTVGKKYGMTRERVRQICSKIERIMRFNRPPINFVKQAIAYANQNIPNTASLIEKGYLERKISRRPFRVEGLITAAKLLGHEVGFGIEKIGRKKLRFVVPKKHEGITTLIVQCARKYIEHWGAGTIEDFTYVVTSKAKHSVNSAYIQTVLETLVDFRWLDKNSGWFWLHKTKRNRILHLVRKILCVAGKLPINDLRDGIRRPHRMRGYSPPRRVLSEICHQTDGYRVENGIVIADPPLNWEEELEETNPHVLVTVLKAFGPVLTRADFEARCLDKGMNRSSFYIYLLYDPLIQKYSRGVYGLRGANISAATIEQLRAKVEKETRRRTKSFAQNKVLLDFGRTNEGSIWVGYKLSDPSIISGVVTTPGPMQRYLAGEFSLYAVDGICMGTLKSNQGSTWGLGPYFRRRGGESGDYMLLLYNLESRKVTVELGDEDILEPFSPEE